MIRKPKTGSGCGTGCLSLLIIMVLAVAGSYFLIRDRLASLEEIEESSNQLELIYGSIYEFTPGLDTKYNLERTARFLQARSIIKDEIDELENGLSDIQLEIDDIKDDTSLWDVFTLIKSGFGLIPEIVRYYKARNNALMEVQMGLGEYLYIYTNAYFVLLKKSPSDGPKFRIEGEGDNQSDKYGDEVFELRYDKISKKINRLAREHLTNLKFQLDKTDPSNKYLRIIEEEIIKLNSNRNLIPWMDSIPEFVNQQFNNYSVELDSSYKLLLNPLEMTDTKN